MSSATTSLPRTFAPQRPSTALRSFLRRWRTALSVASALAIAVLLAAILAGKRGDFSAALHAAPIWLLAVAAILQAVALVARSEAWHVCVGAAGGTVSRRRLYRAASVGYLGTLINGQLGVAARIAALRRSAPSDSPRVPALIAAEIPILTVEATLAALTSFTLVGPLGLPLCCCARSRAGTRPASGAASP